MDFLNIEAVCCKPRLHAFAEVWLVCCATSLFQALCMHFSSHGNHEESILWFRMSTWCSTWRDVLDGDVAFGSVVVFL